MAGGVRMRKASSRSGRGDEQPGGATCQHQKQERPSEAGRKYEFRLGHTEYFQVETHRSDLV